MTPEAFVDRVALLHSQWADRRELRHISGSLFDAQYLLLLKMHEWACEAVSAVQAVYGEQAPTTVGPRPDRDDQSLAFQVTVGTSHTLSIALIESNRAGRPEWRVKATVTLPNGAGPVTVAPARRTTSWTRRGFEDVVLSLLTAYEREL
jgi:hypothetical protein